VTLLFPAYFEANFKNTSRSFWLLHTCWRHFCRSSKWLLRENWIKMNNISSFHSLLLHWNTYRIFETSSCPPWLNSKVWQSEYLQSNGGWLPCFFSTGILIYVLNHHIIRQILSQNFPSKHFSNASQFWHL
jgi:hypothetical protein